MDRRTLVQLSAAALLLPTAVAAQSSQNSLSLERKHASDTLEAGTVALETSPIRMAKGTDANVKRFARFEVAEQETVSMVVKAAAKISAASKASVEGRAMINSLSALPAGKSFDAGYVKVQIDGHKQPLAIQEKYLSGGKGVTPLDCCARSRP